MFAYNIASQMHTGSFGTCQSLLSISTSFRSGQLAKLMIANGLLVYAGQTEAVPGTHASR